jgi:hypothetical protein
LPHKGVTFRYGFSFKLGLFGVHFFRFQSNSQFVHFSLLTVVREKPSFFTSTAS